VLGSREKGIPSATPLQKKKDKGFGISCWMLQTPSSDRGLCSEIIHMPGFLFF